ncbi:MAG: SpoIIE family protein phosphatase [Oscillibacter sp.]|nr:SpoIIE family protein phosphatase [Oscillibacter sp.]
MANGQLILERQQTGRLVRLGIRFFLSAALTAGQTAGGAAPFALGWVAAAGPGLEGGAALAGAVVGAALFLPFAGALPFLAVAVLILAASVALGGTWIPSRPLPMALTAAGLFVTVEGIYILQSLSPLERLRDSLGATGLLAASVWLFFPLLRGGEGREVVDGLIFLAGALVTAVEDLELLGFSPARALLCFLGALAAYDRGPAGGAAFGLGLGLTAELCGSRLPLTAALGLAGLATGSRQGRRRTGAALAFLLSTGAVALAEGQPLPLLAEAAAGTVCFLALPGRFVAGKRVRPAIPPAARREPDAPVPWRQRLDRAAAALRDLYDSIGRSATPAAEENPAIVFDRSAEKVCRSCALCELCWQKDYTGTFNAMNDATPYLLERGRALAKDFPDYFTGRCVHLPDLLTAINGELSAFLLRRQYRRQLEETRRSARGQYAQLSELLTATAAGLEAAAPAMAEGVPCRVGAALRPKEGETVCGDTVAAFRTDRGLWCLLLADGMGSGEPARKESALICRLLQQFLEAGVAPEAALKTLNSAMGLRGADSGAFTTVDLCVYDPEAREAAFYKCGAAPSYLKRGGVVRRITGASLPVGLQGPPPDVTKAPLAPGGFAVMVSDGVADPAEDEWLLNLLAGWTGDDPQELAGLILAESVRREKLRDDCGVQVLYCPETKAREV